MLKNPQLTFALIAFFGALTQELLYWYEIRNKLDEEQNKKLLRSPSYWTITFLMIAVSGIATWLLFYDKGVPYPNKVPFGLGVAFPLIVKKIAAAAQSQHLGDVTTTQSRLKFNFEELTKIYFK